MGGFNHVTNDALQAVGGFNHIHLRAGNHRIAYFKVMKIQYFFHALQSIGIEYGLVVCLPQQFHHFFSGFGRIVGNAVDQAFEKARFRRVFVHLVFILRIRVGVS